MNDNSSVHYFASSVFTWHRGDTADDAVNAVLRYDRSTIERKGGKILEGYEVHVWKVPLPRQASYEIKQYAPDVEGAEHEKKISGDVIAYRLHNLKELED